MKKNLKVIAISIASIASHHLIGTLKNTQHQTDKLIKVNTQDTTFLKMADMRRLIS